MYTYITITYVILSLFLIFLIFLVFERIKFLRNNIFFEKIDKHYFSNYFINIFKNKEDITNDTKLVIINKSKEKVVEKEQIDFSRFCKKFLINKNIEENFLFFLKKNDKYFFDFFYDKKIRRRSIFVEKINQDEEKNILLNFFCFSSNTISIDDEIDKDIANNIFSEAFFFTRIDFYISDDLTKYLIFLKEIVCMIINDEKIYVMPYKNLKNNNILSIFIIDKLNNNIENVKTLINKIIMNVRYFFEKFNFNIFFPIYVGILKKQKSLGNWKNKMNNLMKTGFKKNIEIIDEQIISKNNQIEKNIIDNCHFDFVDIFNVENETCNGYIVRILYNRKDECDLLSLKNTTILEIFYKLIQKIKDISEVTGEYVNNVFIMTKYATIYNNDIFETLQDKICKEFDINIFLCIREKNNFFDSQIISKKFLFNQIIRNKEIYNKIKMCLCLEGKKLFIDDDIHKIFDCFLIFSKDNDYYHIYMEIIRKIFRYNKKIILKTNNANKIDFIIKMGIKDIANNKIKNKLKEIRKIKKEVKNVFF